MSFGAPILPPLLSDPTVDEKFASGIVAAKNGVIKVTREGSTTRLEVGDIVYTGDVIHTPQGGYVEIHFYNSNREVVESDKLKLGEKSTLTVHKSNLRKGVKKLDLFNGTIRVKIKAGIERPKLYSGGSVLSGGVRGTHGAVSEPFGSDAIWEFVEESDPEARQGVFGVLAGPSWAIDLWDLSQMDERFFYGGIKEQEYLREDWFFGISNPLGFIDATTPATTPLSLGVGEYARLDAYGQSLLTEPTSTIDDLLSLGFDFEPSLPGAEDFFVRQEYLLGPESSGIYFPYRIPEPATLALLGIGLSGVGFAKKRESLLKESR